jgi:hypothetical protein
MKNYFYPILLSFILFISCEKENIRKEVFAGVYDSTYTFYEYMPDHIIELFSDSLNLYEDGSDSIDINSDNKNDLIIYIRLTSYNSYSEVYNKYIYPYCILEMHNGLEVATKYESYPVGHGITQNQSWVDTLCYNKRIENITNWSGTDNSQLMWIIPPVPVYYSNGCWYDINKTRYVGLRMMIESNYKYGWIKIHGLPSNNIRLISYAFEK